MKVIVGSKNPVKLKTVEQGFAMMFPDETFEFVTYDAKSGVADQPIGEDETRTGSCNRAKDCATAYPDADYFAGLEGGLVEEGEGFRAVAWMRVQNSEGKFSPAHTGSFLLPKEVSVAIREGMELGHAVDMVFGTSNIKHKEGAVGVLTNGVVDRVAYYVPALVFALIPFVKPELYREE